MTEPIILLGFPPSPQSQALRDRVTMLAPGYRVILSADMDVIRTHLTEIEVAAGRFPRDLLLAAPRLRWMQQWSAGSEWLLRNTEAVAAPFVLTNASGVHAQPIGEHIMALALALTRGLHRAVRAQAEGRWQRPEMANGIAELADQTMLLIGVGAIGERVAHFASAFGMRVVGVRRDPSRLVQDVAEMHGPAALAALLPEADLVVITLPLTHETRHLIGEAQLRAMRSSACLINIGRGGTVDEDALVRALQEGWIAGAGLDVFEREPLPEDSPLWKMENVIVTAHYSGRTPRYDERASAIFLDNLERYLSGQPLRNVVDKERGY